MNSENNDWFTRFSYSHQNMINNYKILKVDYLSKENINWEVFRNKDLTKKQIDIINEMSNYYLEHKDRAIYKKTDFLCNIKEEICICNIHADDFRRIYDNINYKKDQKYISYFKSEKV